MMQYGEMLGGARVKYNESPTQNNEKQQFNNMENYGEILETETETEVENKTFKKIYTDFDDYFNHPVMVKIKDVNNHSMYMCKTYCLLSNECRYIIVFVPQDMIPVNSKEKLVNLRWISLQTRTLSDNHNLPSHAYQPKRDQGLYYTIERIDVSENCSTYKCNDLPVTVTLLHGKNKADDYQKKGNIISALETYQTILTLIE
jgi:hypothetical protein